MRHEPQRGSLTRWGLWALAGLLFVIAGCETTPEGYRFTCTTARNDWKLCNENRVRYCHIDHFHTGQNCEKQGLTCVETGDQTAVCVDKSLTCSTGDAKCENNTAYNCIDGAFSVEPCGTAKTCESGSQGATCKSLKVDCGGNGELHDGKCECNDGFKPDPNDAASCIAA